MNVDKEPSELLAEYLWEEAYYEDIYVQLTDYIMSMHLPQEFEARLLSAVTDVFGY